MSTLTVPHDTWLELCNIADGTFAPLTGFLNSEDYRRVVSEMRLSSGAVWPLPITLDLPRDLAKSVEKDTKLTLLNDDQQEIAEVEIDEIFEVDGASDTEAIFGTKDPEHPGVRRELERSDLRVSGKTHLIQAMEPMFPEFALSPKETKQIFEERGWKTISSFQTRNPAHRAHEYLQRVAMEVTDGILLHPLIGWKKPDDFAPVAVMEAYRTLASDIYPSGQVLLGTLRTPMRYAGPREALFHAIIRRNHGCTHFIVGRDHAGVGDYYGKYEAQQLCLSFDDLGISILALCGPYYCRKCGGIVTEKTCGHGQAYEESVSGTRMRALFSSGEAPPETFMRKEISDVLLRLAEQDELFVGERNGL